MIDLNELSKDTFTIGNLRGLSTLTPDTLKHAATEIVEAQQAFTEYIHAPNTITLRDLAHELADVVICIMTISYRESIDLEHAIKECMEKNLQRVKNVRK